MAYVKRKITDGTMQISAEARLWWPDGNANAVEYWFEQLTEFEPGGKLAFNGYCYSEPRTDAYAVDLGQAELGIKLRAAGTAKARIEVKSLVATRGEAALFGPVTIWTKNASAALTLDGLETVATNKWRRLRKFAWTGAVLGETALDENEGVRDGTKPAAGCNVEFTRVAIGKSQEVWWTLGYEAFGQLDEVERILRTCLLQTVSRTPLPTAHIGTPASYPEWLILAGRRCSPGA
jgi:hypothetical protein